MLRFLKFIYPTLIVLALVEIAFRFMGYPNELFNFVRLTDTGIYPPNEEMELTWGTFPYHVKTNSLGLRGEEPSSDTSITRIAAIGDSVTDGFFVDNDDSWVHKLNALFASHRQQAEVLSIARGRASIDMELSLLREGALPLHPDIVLLTFVSNDIPELLDKNLHDILTMEMPFHPENLGFTDRTFIWFVNNSAFCNAIYSYFWKRKTRQFMDYFTRGIDWGPEDQEKNMALFRKHFGGDLWILERPFTPRTRELVANYLTALQMFFDICHENHIQPVFIYHPSIVMTYDSTSSTYMPELLRSFCAKNNARFLDLTPAMRAAGKDSAVYLAPYDFHNNPAGHTVFANTVYEYLEKEFPSQIRQNK